MDAQSIDTFINTVTVLAGGGVLIGTQILKSKLIPLPFQNKPVPTTIAVSLLATYIALVVQDFQFAWSNWEVAGATLLTVSGVAVIIYNNLIRNWPAAKALEAPKSSSVE